MKEPKLDKRSLRVLMGIAILTFGGEAVARMVTNGAEGPTSEYPKIMMTALEASDEEILRAVWKLKEYKAELVGQMNIYKPRKKGRTDALGN